MQFTERWIERVRPTKKRETYWEDNPNPRERLGLRVSPSGSKTFVQRTFDPATKKMRWKTIGIYPAVSLAQARKAVGQKVETSTPEPQQEVFTFRELSALYLEKWAKRRKRSWQEDERIINKEFIPFLADNDVSSIEKKDCTAIIDRIYDRGAPVMANRAYVLLHKIFVFGMQNDYAKTNPLYMTIKPHKETAKDRILDEQEILMLLDSIFGDGMVTAEVTMRRLILFQFATASRSGEAKSIEWADLHDNLWVIPKEKSKNKEIRILPISPMMRTIIDLQKSDTNSSFIFPSSVTGKAYHSTSENHVLTRIIKKNSMEHFTAHDLRRTAASYMAKFGASRVVLRKILNHVDREVTDIYDRHTYEQEKMDALVSWNDYLLSLLEKINPDWLLVR